MKFSVMFPNSDSTRGRFDANQCTRTSLGYPRICATTATSRTSFCAELSEPAGGLYIAESSKVIERAVRAGSSATLGPDDREMAARDRAASWPTRMPTCPYTSAPADLLQSLTGFNLHRGALASMHRPPLASVADTVDGRQKRSSCSRTSSTTPTSARSSAPSRDSARMPCSSPRAARIRYYRRSVRVSMGTVLQVPWTRLPDWPEGGAMLKELGFQTRGVSRYPPDAVTLDEYAQDPPDEARAHHGHRGRRSQPRGTRRRRHGRDHPDDARRRFAQRRIGERRGSVCAAAPPR